MGLFNSQPGAIGDSREAVTLIGEEAYFHGLIAVKGSLRVEGVVEGDITDALSVEIGRKGRVKGNIATATISIAGEVIGDVIASKHVEVLAKGRLCGGVRTPNLRIEDGAQFNGHCAMGSDEPESPSPDEDSALRQIKEEAQSLRETERQL